MTKFKVLNALLFRCSSIDCPKHRDSYSSQIKTASEPIWDQFKWTGCAQFKTFIYGLSEQTHSESEWQEAPLIGVILPCPDPTGAQGAGTGHGVGRDIILESIFAAHTGPLRVAIFYLTRGYSFEKIYRGDIIPKPINQAAISNCAPYIFQEILQLNPRKLLLCGNEVGDLFFPKSFNLPEYRRENNLTITISNRQFPVQVTYAPHFCAINPSYLKIVREDCKKLFETTEPFPLGNYKILKTLSEVLDYLDMLSEFEGFIAVDTETENLNRKASNRLGTIQFATDTSLGVVIPYQHRETPFDTNELNLIAKRLKLLFKSKIRAAGWVGHNVKFEHTVFYNHFGTRIKSADIYDTQAMAFLLDETRSERKADVPRNMGIYTLKVLAWDYLNFDGYNKGILKEREEGTLIDLPLDALAEYGALDAYITLALKNKIEEKAAEEGYLKQMIKLARLYYGPASHLVSHVEYQGFKTDLKAVRELAANRGPFNKRLEELTEEFKQMPAFIEANNILVRKKNAGNPKGVFGKVPWILDIAKPGNKKLVFFDIMGLEPVSFSDKTGQAAVDDEFIDAYREEHPEVEKYAQFSETTKMLDTFIVKALDRVDPETGDPDCKLDQRIRPSFHISRLVTGRWAVTHPNMQQLPRVPEGIEDGVFEVRKAVKDLYTVDTNCGLIQVDYKVNEVRWAAILAKDNSLARIFNEAAINLKQAQESEDPELLKKAEFAEDIHRATAKDMFNCSLEEVAKAQRSAAKCVHPETLIYTPEGWKRIGSLDKINRNGDTFSDIKEKVWDNTTNDFVDAYKFYSKGCEDSLGIVTSKGVLICSKNHRIKLASGQLIFAENLKKGDLLAFDTPPPAKTLEYQVINFNPFFKNYEPTCSPYQVKITEDLAYALGAFIGDGSAPVRRLHFKVGAPEKYDPWKKSIMESFHKIGFRAYILKNKKDIYLGSESEANFFRQLGILTSKKEELKIREIKKQKNYKKVLHPRKLLRIPDYIFNSPDSVKLSFLAGLFDTDGTAASRDGRISISTKSLLLTQDVSALLFQLGFNYNVNSHYNYIYNRNYFLINLRSEHIKDVLPYTRHPLKKEILQKFKDAKKRKPTQFAKVQSIEVSLPELLNCHLVDITVDTQDHLFLTNGFSSHNCVTFGILFQQSAKALAVNLNCSEEQAEEYISMYFNKMVGVKNLVETLKRSAVEKGFVEAPHGRRRRFWSHLLPLTWKGRRKHISRSSRQAVNSPIQGCQDEDDFISTLQGPIRLKNLNPLVHTLYTYSGKTSRYKVHDTGIQKTFMVNTTVGCARTTKDHRYFIYENKDFVVKKLEELKVGDWVLGSEIHWDNPYTDSSELIKLAEVQAIVIGDGSYNSNKTVAIAFEKKEGYIDYVKDLIKCIYPTSNGEIEKSSGSEGICWRLTYHDASLKKFLNRNGLVDRTSHQKRLPEWIFNASEKVRLAALRGLYDTDGGIVKAKGKGERCVFTTVSEHLAYDFYSLALSCNIKSAIYPYDNCYRVKIDSKHSENFIKKIKPWHKYKTKIKNSNKSKLLPPQLIKDVASFVLNSYEWNELLPKEAYSKYSRTAPKKNFTSQERSHLYRLKEGSGSTSSCLYFLNKLAQSPGRDNLLELCKMPWGQIYRIKPLGFKRTKDIEILTKDHSYISNGILMHNCASDGGMVGGSYQLLEYIEENNLNWKIQNLVHDSCIIQVPKNEIEFAINLMQSIFVDKAMEKMAEMGVEFNLPLGIDVEVGIHWGSLEKWKGTKTHARELEKMVKDYWDKI